MGTFKYSYATLTEAVDGGLKTLAETTPEDRRETTYLSRPAIFRLTDGTYHAAITQAGFNAHKHNPFYKGTEFLGFLNSDGGLTKW